jgi:hypothetical protein
MRLDTSEQTNSTTLTRVMSLECDWSWAQNETFVVVSGFCCGDVSEQISKKVDYNHKFHICIIEELCRDLIID